DLVAGRVAVEPARLGGRGGEQAHVVVGEQQPAATDEVAARLELAGAEVAGEERLVGRDAGAVAGGRPDRLGPDEGGGGPAVVEQRRVRREAVGAHELLGVEAAVGGAELGVALGRDLAHPAVVRHRHLLGGRRVLCASWVTAGTSARRRTLTSVARRCLVGWTPRSRARPPLRRRRAVPARQAPDGRGARGPRPGARRPPPRRRGPVPLPGGAPGRARGLRRRGGGAAAGA